MTTVPLNPPSVPEGHTATEGVAAMIPVANITLEDALLDNPNFRANIKLFEGQVFFIEGWLVALQQSIKKVTDEWEKLNEVTSVLNKRAEVPLLSQGMLSAQYTIPAMKLVGGAFRTMLALKHQYISEVNEKIVRPLEEFLKNDLKEFKESKKAFDKALEKYESALAKYSGQSRQKEPSALREEAFQLYDTRKAYIQAAMSCAMLCIKFQDGLDQLVLGVFLGIMATQHDYFSGNADHFGSMALQVLQLKTYMREHHGASEIALAELQQTKERYTADAIEYWKPSRSLKCYSNNVVSTVKPSSIGSALLAATQIAGQTPAVPFLMSRQPSSSISRVSTNESLRSAFNSHPSMHSMASSEDGTNGFVNLPHSKSLDSLTQLDVSSALNTNGTPERSPQPPLSSSSTITNLVLCENTNDVTPTTKQGYLNIRIPQPKNRAPVWQRKYFFIQQGEFGFESVVSSPSVGSQVVQSERISVLLCEVRYGNSANALMALNGNGGNGSGNSSSNSSSANNQAGNGLAMVQMERRFCFEVVCSTQSYVLQAETEDDLLSWIHTFEAAKREAHIQQQLPKFPDAEEPYSPMPLTESAQTRFSFSPEDQLQSALNAQQQQQQQECKASGSSGPLGWAASVPGFNLLLNSYTGTTSSSGGDTSAPTGAKADGDGADAVEKPAEDSAAHVTEPSAGAAVSENPATSETNSSTTPPPVDSAAAPASSSGNGRKAREPPPMLDTRQRKPSEARAVTLYNTSGATDDAIDTGAGVNGESSGASQPSQLEKLMSSSHHLVPKAVPSAAAEIPHYPMELVVRNRELHHRFMGTKLHQKEYVLHSWTSGYWDDCRPTPIMVYGRIYLTQSGMYFYSRDLSIETRRMFRFSAIQGIECEQKDILTEWRIETLDGHQHVFSQFTLADTEYHVLKLIWTNAHSQSGRLPVKDLFRKTIRITSKPKFTAGSGSLAETESTHGTRSEGIVHHGGGRVSLTAPPKGNAATGQGAARNEVALSNPEDAFPADMQRPAEPVECLCPGHLERLESERVFNIPAKALNRLIADDESPLWREFHERRSNSRREVGQWHNEGGKKTRTVKFLMVVNNPMVKLNETDCIETHTCEVEEEHLRYSYTVRSSVPAMPYSDAFTPVTRYCITYVSPTSCKLTCSSGIEWHKNPLVKAMIKGAIIKGTAETVRDLNEILDVQLSSDDSGVAREAVNGHSKQSSSSPSGVDTPTRPRHSRSTSSKVKIALVDSESKEERMLLDSELEYSEDEVNTNTVAEATAAHHATASTTATSTASALASAAVAAARTLGASKGEGRVPGARRHTVSTSASDGIHPFVHPDARARVKGHWPTGEQPKFVPLGSKESRTRLLGRPSRSTLMADKKDIVAAAKNGTQNSTAQGGLLYRLLYGSSAALSSETPAQRQRRALVRMFAFFLIMSSLMNIWAAWNSKRLLESTWRIQRHEMLFHHNIGSDSEGVLRKDGGDIAAALNREHAQYHQHRHQHPHTQRASPRPKNTRASVRAVYLKDLEDRILDSRLAQDIQDKLIDAKCFQTFLEIKETFHPWVLNSSLMSATPTPSSAPPSEETAIVPVKRENRSEASSTPPSPSTTYPWILPLHKRWATRIIFQRDRIGILRYDLLTTFERLNHLERRLLETEYMNWIMDEKLRCRIWEQVKKKRKAASQEQKQTESNGRPEQAGRADEDTNTAAVDPRVTDEFCEGVNRQLKLFSHRK